MRLATFIRLEDSFEKAMNYANSPQMTEYSFEGVQLLPNNILPYIQRTYADNGIEIEDYEVRVMSLCQKELAVITPYFEVISNFQDPYTGKPQIDWKLYEVPFDFDYKLVYLEINTGADKYYYSSPFYLTAHSADYTSQWYYGNANNEKLKSIGLRFYFRQPKSLMEISNYTSISSGRTFTTSAKNTPYEKWNTDVNDIYTFQRLQELFLSKYIYSKGLNDSLPVRTGLYEAFEIPDLEMDENSAEQEINLVREYALQYDPNYIPVDPPPPDPDAPLINLISVTNNFKGGVTYVFELINFSPTYLLYEWSFDGETWTSSAGDVISPTDVNVGMTDMYNFQYRITHLSGVTSNIVSLPVPSIVIDNITSPQTSFNTIGNNYYVFFTLNSFDADPASLSFVASPTEFGSYVPLYYSSGITSPKAVQTPSSGLEFKWFKILYNPLGIESEPYNFEY